MPPAALPEPLAPPVRPTRREWLGAAALVLTALGLRVVHLLEIRRNDPFFALPSVDPRVYHEWALEISRGDWLGDQVFFLGPLYPYFLGALYTVFGPSFLVTKSVQCVLGALTCGLVWWVARHFFERRVALLAGALAAVYSMLIFYGGTLMIVNVLVPLTLLMLLAVARALEVPSVARWLAAGALLGLTALARQTAILYAPLVAAWLLWALRARLTPARRVGCLAAFAAGAALLILPATVRNYVVSGDWVLINASAGNAMITANHDGADGTFHLPREIPREAADDPREQRAILERIAEQELGRELLPSEVSAFWTARALDWIRSEPGDFLRLVVRRLGLFFNAFEAWTNRSYTISMAFSRVLRLPLLGFGLVAPLGLLGLGLGAARWRRLFPLYALLGVYLGSAVLFIVLSRYRMPVVPIYLMFAASALVWAFDALRARRLLRLATAAVALVPLAAFVHIPIAAENLAMAYYNLANKYLHLGSYDQAIDNYWISIRGDPSYVPAYNNLALAYEESGQEREAIIAWQEVLKIGRQRGLPEYIGRASRRLAGLHARRARPPEADAPRAPEPLRRGGGGR